MILVFRLQANRKLLFWISLRVTGEVHSFYQ